MCNRRRWKIKNTYSVEVNLNGKFLIDVQADTKEEAEKIARETLEDTKIKDALIKYKNKLNMISKIKEKSDYER